MPDTPDVYVVYSVGCGHPIMATSDRDAALRLAGDSPRWSVKVATDADLITILAGTKCDVCVAAAVDLRSRVPAALAGLVPAQHRPPDQWECMAIMPGVTVNKPAAIQEVQRGTHDRLLAAVRHKACGPVYWRHFHGEAEIREALASVLPDEPAPDVIAALRPVRGTAQPVRRQRRAG